MGIGKIEFGNVTKNTVDFYSEKSTKMNEFQFAFLKIRDVKSPSRAHEKDNGIDWWIPIDFPETTLKPGERALIPSGIKVRLPENNTLLFVNKSGIAAKLGLTVGSCLVDTGYEGEVHLSLINTSTENVVLKPGMKIVQSLLLPINMVNPEEVKTEEELYAGLESSRGKNGFGSSGV